MKKIKGYTKTCKGIYEQQLTNSIFCAKFKMAGNVAYLMWLRSAVDGREQSILAPAEWTRARCCENRRRSHGSSNNSLKWKFFIRQNLFTYLFVYLFITVFVYLFISILSIYLFKCLSVYLSCLFYLSLYHLTIYKSIYLSICLYVCLSIC